MKWIIYHYYNKIILSKYIQIYLNIKYKIYYSNNILNSIIIKHELISLDSIMIWKKDIIILKMIIDKILIKISYKYIKYEYCIIIWEFMIYHFMK